MSVAKVRQDREGLTAVLGADIVYPLRDYLKRRKTRV